MPDHIGTVKETVMNKEVLEWVREAPFDDANAMQLRRDFSYDEWFTRGRALPGALETLVEILEKEDLVHPSGDGMRVAYALGWIGDRRKRIVEVLLRALGSRDIALRREAVSALGRQGDMSVLPTLENLLTNKNEDVNIRGNACISIGRIGSPSSEALLRAALGDKDPFIVACAQEALRLLGSDGQ
jgi:HEAT repeat protein